MMQYKCGIKNGQVQTVQFVTVKLPLGSHQYKYIVNGAWIHDPSKPTCEDGKGGYNNVVEVLPRAIEAEQSDSDDEINSYNTNESGDINIKIRTHLDAPELEVLGSWDNWNNKIKLKKTFSHIQNKYIHYAKLSLPPGKYEYKFVSGDIFMHDPEQKIIKNTFGSFNNLIMVNEKKECNLSTQSQDGNDYMRQLVWRSAKVSKDFVFDQMLIGHSLNIVGNVLYVFGGQRGGQFMNRFYAYNVKEQEMEHVQMYGNTPSPRAYCKTVSFGNKILFYGGIDHNSILQDYHVFNTITNTWSTSKLFGQGPPPRERFTLSHYKQQALIIFGGYYCSSDMEAEQHYNDIYSLNLKTMTWKELQPVGKKPAPRYAHTSNSFKQYIIIFGGMNSSSSKKIYNDAWKIGLENNELRWENISEVATGKPPMERYSHSATMVNEFLVIFGGRNQKMQTLNDVVVLDLIRNEWIYPDLSGDIPKCRINHAACQWEPNDGVIIFGGNLLFDNHKKLDLSNGFLFYLLTPKIQPNSLGWSLEQQFKQNIGQQESDDEFECLTNNIANNIRSLSYDGQENTQ
ncbi:Immunoglobulin E-set [Pseudocohnilembus persalinus]|uniref:Immunoglobulin E-set n=1 Tax=Pseudocohnilembus persalinus TaxID=266149 RepID=A0A0V0QXC0_PSEPJ|nr:Immunoglobulin E-set [Pseudocohnilembus persalinus]|eukprot:KRX06891.1 Immunoglobulin E-set [Pseudocohnilembus persalinus]